MELQPYKLTVIKTEEELGKIPAAALAKHFSFLSTINPPSFSVDSLTDIIFATSFEFERIIQSFKNIGVNVKYSVKQGHDYVFNNQATINKLGKPDFVCASVLYICDNFNSDSVLDKIIAGNKNLTPADKYLLETV